MTAKMDGDHFRVKAASAVADAVRLDTAGNPEAAAESYHEAACALRTLIENGLLSDADRESLDKVLVYVCLRVSVCVHLRACILHSFSFLAFLHV
jgi:hypothetical protein